MLSLSDRSRAKNTKRVMHRPQICDNDSYGKGSYRNVLKALSHSHILLYVVDADYILNTKSLI